MSRPLSVISAPGRTGIRWIWGQVYRASLYLKRHGHWCFFNMHYQKLGMLNTKQHMATMFELDAFVFFWIAIPAQMHLIIKAIFFKKKGIHSFLATVSRHESKQGSTRSCVYTQLRKHAGDAVLTCKNC